MMEKRAKIESFSIFFIQCVNIADVFTLNAALTSKRLSKQMLHYVY